MTREHRRDLETTGTDLPGLCEVSVHTINGGVNSASGEHYTQRESFVRRSS